MAADLVAERTTGAGAGVGSGNGPAVVAGAATGAAMGEAVACRRCNFFLLLAFFFLAISPLY